MSRALSFLKYPAITLGAFLYSHPSFAAQAYGATEALRDWDVRHLGLEMAILSILTGFAISGHKGSAVPALVFSAGGACWYWLPPLLIQKFMA